MTTNNWETEALRTSPKVTWLVGDGAGREPELPSYPAMHAEGSSYTDLCPGGKK